MSTVRFLHTDHLRLATPLAGLSDSPAWLQRLATNCVRQAVRNVIDAATAHEAEFLFIAGSITDVHEDLSSAAYWLNEQFRALRSRGIRIVASAASRESAGVLQELCDIVLYNDQVLDVSRDRSGELQLTTTQPARVSGPLSIGVGNRSFECASEMFYRAVPTAKFSSDAGKAGRSGRLTVSAGAVQALSHDEDWDCGCVLAEADFSSRMIRTTFLETDVMRFATEPVDVGNAATPQEFVAEIVRASATIQNRDSQTIIVDWVVYGQIPGSSGCFEQFSRCQFLATLRNQLHGGHHGVWPRSVSFAEEAGLSVPNSVGTAICEFVKVATDASGGRRGEWSGEYSRVAGGSSGIPEELLTGLSLLERVA